MEIRRRIGAATAAVDVDDRCAEEMLGVDIGNRCCKAALDGWKTVEVGEITGVVGEGVGREDLLRFSLAVILK